VKFAQENLDEGDPDARFARVVSAGKYAIELAGLLLPFI
jgi:hypothetical protein